MLSHLTLLVCFKIHHYDRVLVYLIYFVLWIYSILFQVTVSLGKTVKGKSPLYILIDEPAQI